jgi:hypothetical protein
VDGLSFDPSLILLPSDSVKSIQNSVKYLYNGVKADGRQWAAGCGQGRAASLSGNNPATNHRGMKGNV